MNTKLVRFIRNYKVTSWNRWRGRYPDKEVDLQKADLQNLDLSGANLRNSNLMGTCFQKTNLSNSDLRGAKLRYCQLHMANLNGARFSLEIPNENYLFKLVADEVVNHPHRLKVSEGWDQCIAGWSFRLDSKAGQLQESLGSSTAAFICFPNHHDLLFTSNEKAIEFLRRFIDEN